MARSVNTVIIIGNLTRDPEMRYTPAGHPVTNFSVATNRVWTTADGERREETEFHDVVAWNKLAEICNQYLRKGRKVYVRGRLQTRRWHAADGSPRSKTEIVAEDMVILDRGPLAPREEATAKETSPVETAVPDEAPAPATTGMEESVPTEEEEQVKEESVNQQEKKEAVGEQGESGQKAKETATGEEEEVNPNEMPF